MTKRPFCIGMLIVRGAMDPDWLADAYAAIDYISAPDAPREPAAAHTDPDQWQTHSSFFAGQPSPAVSTGRQMWDPARWPDGAPPGGLLGLPRPHCDPFRRMLTCPALVHRLNWMMGAGWALAHGSLGIRTTRRGEAVSTHLRCVLILSATLDPFLQGIQGHLRSNGTDNTITHPPDLWNVAAMSSISPAWHDNMDDMACCCCCCCCASAGQCGRLFRVYICMRVVPLLARAIC